MRKEILLHQLQIVKVQNFYYIEGNISELKKLEIYMEYSIIGNDISGHILASIFGIMNKQSIAFTRKRKKNHGICQEIDGIISKNNKCIVFVDVESQIEMNTSNYNEIIIVKFKVDNKEFFEYPNYNYNQNITLVKNNNNKKISEYIIKKEGKFVLSSGKYTDTYYESLPAAHHYDCIESCIAELNLKLNDGESIIGIGHGGIYFATMLALNYKLPLVIYYHTKQKSTSIPKFKNIILVDDFISTGLSIKKAMNEIDYEKYQAISIFSKKNMVIDLDFNLKILEKI